MQNILIRNIKDIENAINMSKDDEEELKYLFSKHKVFVLILSMAFPPKNRH